MLHPNAQKRIGVEQIWKHPWLLDSLKNEIKEFENLEKL